MNHNLKISIAREPAGVIVGCRTLTVRERIMKLVFGEKLRLTVIVPGNSVERLSITEVREDSDDERT